ncbi:NADH-quinone oxidoreductase subunit C [Streptomyces sp. NPDC006464]|uniref:NADH-quinone oxidoreductase subunit C n=1 Tax=Streptomyces sp. NPDC006464 TaxID=3154305 RepID=UPI0033BE16EC
MTGGGHPYDTLPDGVTQVFGAEATAERAYDLLTVDVPADGWITALRTARDELGCTFFDWLSAVDEPGTGFRVCAHVVALGPGTVRRLLLRTTVPHAAAALPTAVEVYAGAAWHERETHEMFGVEFTGHPHLVPLLLPENFEGHPLRKDFVLAARVAKAWPGAKEPGESEHGGPKRRQMLPPGVPDPNDWGPMKGQLPPAPARTPRAAGDRPVRRTRTTAEGSAGTPETPGTTPAAPAAGEAPAARPPRRTRSVSEGSASQTAEAAEAAGSEGAAEAPQPAAGPRRSRSAADGSASQAAPAPAGEDTAPRPARRSRSAGEGSATQRAEEQTGAEAPPRTPSGPRRSRSAADGSASQSEAPASSPTPPRTRSTDAPWHHARPAFEEKTSGESPPDADAGPAREPDAAPEPGADAEPGPGTAPAPGAAPAPEPGTAPAPEPGPDTAPEPDAAPEEEADASSPPDGAPRTPPTTEDPAGGDSA